MRKLLHVALCAALLTFTAGGIARAQSVIFADDFEGGTAAWTMTAEWHLAGDSQPCASKAAPFPSGGLAARFGRRTGSCFFDTAAGRLTTAAPVSIPAGAKKARLRFKSFEETECSTFSGGNGGNCGWDHRYVKISTDGGLFWQTIWQGGVEGLWIEKSVDLTPHIGKDVWIAFEFDPIDGVWNDFLGWLVDDVQVEIDHFGGPSIYCTAKVNSLGCEPLVAYSGSASQSGPDDLHVTCTNLRSNVLTKLFWSTGRDGSPFAGGTLCVELPALRTTVLSSGGTPLVPDCSGSYDWHFSHAYLAQNGVGAGTTIYVQTSARDFGYSPPQNNHSLSAGVSVPLLP